MGFKSIIGKTFIGKTGPATLRNLVFEPAAKKEKKKVHDRTP